MRKQEKSSGIQIMSVIRMTAYLAVYSLQSRAEKTVFPTIYMLQCPKPRTMHQVFLPASKNQTDLKHGKIPPHMHGHRRSAFITKMEVEKYFIVTVQGMYGCLMVKQENWKIRCPSVTVSSKHHRLCTIIMQLLVPETAKYGELK